MAKDVAELEMWQSLRLATPQDVAKNMKIDGTLCFTLSKYMFHNYYFFFSDIFIEETAQTDKIPVIVDEKNQNYTQFDEFSLLSNLKKNQQKKAKEIIRKIKEQGDQLTFDSTGQIFIEGKSIPGSNISKLLHCLFNAKSNVQGFQEFVKKLQQMGLSRFLPKKSLPIKEEATKKSEESPYNLDKWYYIGP